MNTNDRRAIIRERVYEAINTFLEDERRNLEKPLEDTDVFEARGFDSLDVLEITLGLEVKFESTISFSDEDLTHIVSVQDLIDLVGRMLPEDYLLIGPN